jgi:hypothetical protein
MKENDMFGICEREERLVQGFDWKTRIKETTWKT